MKSNIVLLSVVAVMVVGGILLGKFLLRPKIHMPRASVSVVDRVQSGDLNTLANPQATENEIYLAMLRLAGGPHSAKARERAISVVDHPSPTLRSAAAEVLGVSNDADHDRLLFRLAEDEDEGVRVRTLAAMAKIKSERRSQFLRDRLKGGGLKGVERIQIAGTLALLTSDAKERARIVKDLEGSSTKGNGRESLEALAFWVRIEPLSSELIKHARGVLIRTGSDESASALAFRHLAALRDPWLAQNFEKFINGKQTRLRLLAVQSLHLFCPKERWRFLEAVANEKDNAGLLNSAAHEAWLLGEAGSKEFLDKLAQLTRGDQVLQRNIEALRNRPTPQSRPPCE